MKLGPSAQQLLPEILELSMVEIFILQNLRKYTHETLRFKILEDVNSQLPEENQFTPTKFYHALKTLVNKGYIELITGEKKGSSLVKTTQKINTLFEFLVPQLAYSSVDFFTIMQDLVSSFFQKYKLKLPKKTLVVLESDEYMVDPRKLQAYFQFTDRLYLLTSDKKFQHYQNRNPDTELIQTQWSGEKIRESNEFYDVILILESIENISTQLFLELYRVLTTEGIIVVATLKPVPITDHVLIDHSFRLLQDPHNKFAELEKQMENLFASNNFSKVETFTYLGFIIKWARKINSS